jgi:DNA-binding response OmpR family regulator
MIAQGHQVSRSVVILGSTEVSGSRVLVVDDNKAMRDSLTDILRMAGYRTDGVARPDEAAAELAKGDVALVMLDVGLDFSGLRALDGLAKKPHTILMSCQPHRRRTARGSVFLCRPFEPPRLLDEVERVLGRPG